MADLGKPAFKLGWAEIDVGWRAHELKVSVAADRMVYKVRESARVAVRVSTADGQPPPAGSEVALAAVDEGLLELMANTSWSLLAGMMGRRGCEVQTATAQMHVVGKRHYGIKALPQGGGGGRQATRELFDTLLLWKARLPLDERGRRRRWMCRSTMPSPPSASSRWHPAGRACSGPARPPSDPPRT